MKIQYTQFAPNPSLRGTITNLPAHVAQVLIAQGVAVNVPYKDFREMLTAEANPPAKAPVIEWGVQEANLSQFSRVTVIRRCGSETTYFAAPPADCPPTIVARFKELTDGTEQEVLSPLYAAIVAGGAFASDSNKHRPVVIGHDEQGKPIVRDPRDFISRK